jgi:hypothetical protein
MIAWQAQASSTGVPANSPGSATGSKGQPGYHYEKPLVFDPPTHTWSVKRVVIGDSTSSGLGITLHARLVGSVTAAGYATYDGSDYVLDDLPGDPVGQMHVTRTNQVGNCA